MDKIPEPRRLAFTLAKDSLNRIHDGLGLGIDLDVYPVTGSASADVGSGQCFRYQIDVKFCTRYPADGETDAIDADVALGKQIAGVLLRQRKSDLMIVFAADHFNDFGGA